MEGPRDCDIRVPRPEHSVKTIPAGRAVFKQSASESIETEYSSERYNQIIR